MCAHIPNYSSQMDDYKLCWALISSSRGRCHRPIRCTQGRRRKWFWCDNRTHERAENYKKWIRMLPCVIELNDTSTKRSCSRMKFAMNCINMRNWCVHEAYIFKFDGMSLSCAALSLAHADYMLPECLSVSMSLMSSSLPSSSNGFITSANNTA